MSLWETGSGRERGDHVSRLTVAPTARKLEASAQRALRVKVSTPPGLGARREEEDGEKWEELETGGKQMERNRWREKELREEKLGNESACPGTGTLLRPSSLHPSNRARETERGRLEQLAGGLQSEASRLPALQNSRRH